MASLSAMAQASGGQAIPSTEPADLTGGIARVFLTVHGVK